MQRLILIRHSLPEIVGDEPSREWVLSEEGLLRASMMSVSVAAMQPAAIATSTEPKAVSTAEAIVGITGLPLNTDPRFNEHDRGNEPHVPADEFVSVVTRALREPGQLVYGSETITAAVLRFEQAVQAAFENGVDGDLVVVSHGTVIAAYVSAKTGTDAVALWQSLGMPGLICLNWPEPDTVLLRQNFG